LQAHLKVIQELLLSREEEYAAERQAWKAKVSGRRRAGGSCSLRSSSAAALTRDHRAPSQVRYLDQKVASQQRLIDGQQQDLCSQQHEFLARVHFLEAKLANMESALGGRAAQQQDTPPVRLPAALPRCCA
jgi:hypothetical protein